MDKIKMSDKYTKYFIACIVFIGLLAGFSTFNSENSKYKKLIAEAVLSNNICATKFLIKHGANVNAEYKYNHTLLHSAALYGDIQMVEVLVQAGAELSKNDFGLSAVDSARDNDNSDVVEFLVKFYDGLDKIQ